ncbi:3-dehydroquinate synthase II [Marinicrinis sediminis]|uniref:3-dehydroquinate synthase II n=1 Tax=Marinicrinis sediminis TaxID=1652465 RepID=A0ABW5R4J9_9BACL
MTLQYGAVMSISEIGVGMRVCLDTTDLLNPTEGIWVGNTGHGYVFVAAETRTTETYPPRPFRINGGAIHQYVRQGGETRYLSDFQPGACIEVSDWEGEVRSIPLGRMKFEKRPLLRLEVSLEDGTKITATLQQADSVHVWKEEVGAYPLIQIKPGDRIRVQSDIPGRHLGERIEEEIIEK